MHNKNLDGLRGWAAFTVIIFHAILHYDHGNWQKLAISPMSTFSNFNDWITGLALIIFNGDTAVVVFFVMSGLVLHESLIRSKENMLRTCSMFIVKRLFRIYPAVIVATLLTFALSNLWVSLGVDSKSFNYQQMIENLTLQGNAVLGVSWTLTVEMLAVLFILPIFLFYRLFGGIAIFVALSYAMISPDNPSLVFGIQNMHAALLAFVAGMSLALPQVGEFFKKSSKWAWLPILLMTIFGSHINYAWSSSSIILRIVSCAALVGLMRHAENAVLDGFLSNKISQYLGKISFSFYLFTVPVAYATYALTPSLPPSYAAIAGIPLGLLIAALTFPVAVLTYNLIEKPSIRAGSKIAAILATVKPIIETTPKTVIRP